METDADRLAQIQALGGQLVVIDDSPIWVVFDNGFLEAGDIPGVETKQPSLTCRTSDVKEWPKDAPVEIGSELYRVKRHEPDGTGMSRILLKR